MTFKLLHLLLVSAIQGQDVGHINVQKCRWNKYVKTHGGQQMEYFELPSDRHNLESEQSHTLRQHPDAMQGF